MNIMSMLFPDKCIVCGTVLTGGRRGVCVPCKKKLPEVRQPVCLHCGKPIASIRQEYCLDCRGKKSNLTAGVALWEYRGCMKQVMSAFKYGGCEEDASFFAEEMLARYKQKILDWSAEVMIPVPLYRRKLWFRGYNQAESLACAIGERLQIPVRADILKRNRRTEPQKGLDPKSRLANLTGAFSAVKDAENTLRGCRRALLVDDIYTTGATLEACAGVLKNIGINEVYFVCLCTGSDF